GGEDVGGRKNVERPQRDVACRPDGRGNEVEPGGQCVDPAGHRRGPSPAFTSRGGAHSLAAVRLPPKWTRGPSHEDRAMFAVLSTRRKALTRAALLAAAVLVAACEPLPSGRAPAIDAGAPVPVALILPGGSGSSGDEVLARNLKQAADLAIADLQGVRIDLRVYNAGSDAGTSAAMARKAVDEGAKIILGPVFAEA